MRESSHRRTIRFAGRSQPTRQADNLFHHTRHQLLLATVLAVGAMLWVHALAYATGNPLLSHLPYLGLDVLFAVPVAGAAVLAAGWLRPRLGVGDGMLARTATVAAVFTVLLVPLAALQGYGHTVLGSAPAYQHGAGDLAALAGYGATTALQAWPAVLAAALLGVLGQRLLAEPAFRRRAWRWVVGSRRPLTVVSAAGAVLAGMAVAAVLPASPAVAQAGGCNSGAPTRTFDVSAIDVTITLNRHGDNDPYGYMYALNQDIPEIREFEQKLEKASVAGQRFDANGVQLPPDPNWPELIANDPEATFVSSGLDQDPIQPLVLRARLGECVVINFTNRLDADEFDTSRNSLAPVSGSSRRLFEFPGGVPSVSIDMQGVSYDAAGGEGGQDVGNNSSGNTPTMVGPGGSTQYRFFLDPVMGEGTRTFRSGGESAQLTAHGLFGALIAEPADAHWFDPDTGQDMTGDGTAATAWSNWEAMIQAPSEEVSTFREFAILYHEVGDETYAIRRPRREAFPPAAGASAEMDDPFDSGRKIGGAGPMVDRRAPDADPFNRGAGTASYRPGGKAINYRSESFFRRLQHETLLVNLNNPGDPTNPTEAAEQQLNNKSLGYSSYTYGDPATPIAESYLGEPTKTRLAHVGFEQLHVHHLHGGADRWRQNPNADDTAMDSGLDKDPLQDATSIRVDSQTISPQESFNLEHECGAGGCQQAAGDFLYHCHIAHHYISGMWGIWRVFDTEQDADRDDNLFTPQDDLAPLPGASPPDPGVNSAALIGTNAADGKEIVPGEGETADTIGIDTWVQQQLPPQGVDIDRQDATVWDYLRSGPDDAPVYLGEPEYGDPTKTAPLAEPRSWENYRSDTPGMRKQILFNPNNGRPAFPLLQPQLGERPPFAPNEHSGAPWLGEDVGPGRPDGLCPVPEGSEQLRTYNVTAVTTEIQMTARELDPTGMLFMLNDEFTIGSDGLADTVPGKVKEPLAIRSNVGDCVAITLGNQIDRDAAKDNGFKELLKTNMHSHFIQFDPQASDGVITGFSFEQSVFSTERDGRTLNSVSPDGRTVSVTQTDNLHADTNPGIAIAVGIGTPNIEIRTIESVDTTNDTITFTQPLENSHATGVPVSVEFVQYRWYSDVDSGTVFWHDHVDGIISWAHGLFGAHIIEPPGSTYHDPVTGEEVDSGTIVDIRNTEGGSVGVGQQGSFREFMVFLHNGRPSSPITSSAPGNGPGSLQNRFGQECEEATINLRAAPLGERTPHGAVISDPAGDALDVVPSPTQLQRFEFNGDAECRNSFDRDGPPSPRPDTPSLVGSVKATVTTVDPYAFSSVKYGDPETPLFRAYEGDDVVIRTLGSNERAEGLRFQGHRFRMERFNNDGRLMDTAITGISERFDYVLDGGAGGTGNVAGDFLYYSSRTFALESGAWGIFRVHDTLQDDTSGLELKPLPDNQPPTGNGFPVLAPNQADDPQDNPGADPPAAGPGTVSDTSDPCPRGANQRIYSITAFDFPLPSAPFSDTEGVVYALTSDVAAIRAGEKEIEPLVLRVNQGDCVVIRLRNRIQSDDSADGTGPGSRYGGTRAGLDLSMLARNQQLNGGAAVGLNPDNTAAAGQDTIYRFFADQEVGTTVFQNLASPASLRHGAYGTLVVEPAGSQWFDSATGEPLSGTRTSTEAVIDPPNGPSFREFALSLQSTDQQYSRSVVPYVDVVAGSGINSLRAVLGGANDGQQVEVTAAPVAGAPPGTRDTNGSFNKGFNHVNYHSAPLTERIGLTAAPGSHPTLGAPGWFICNGTAVACNPEFEVANPFGTAFSSNPHQDPATPVLEAHSGDPVVIRLAVPASDQLHSFVVSGHLFPMEPNMWNGTTDRRSQLMSARTLTGGMTLDVELVGGAGGPSGHSGDYAYRDGRQPFTQAGMWGILRVLPSGGGIIPLP